MAEHEIDIDPVTHITVDAIGQPGQRVFYLQAWQNQLSYTLLLEKIQIQSLAIGIEQFMAELSSRFPDLPEASNEYDENKMHIQTPVDPIFRVGEISLAYDNDRDRVVLITREILTDDLAPEGTRTYPYWCTRAQLRALGTWGLEVAGRGRPLCPQCGQPMEPEGHFCPKKNGHKH